jgi:hypothetical protein
MKIISVLLLCAAALSAEVKLGKPFTLKEATPVGQVLASPDQFAGKTIQVKGKITEVCQAMGCWMALADLQSGKSIQIKVNDGEITFPKKAAGKLAIAEGKLVKLQLTKDQAIARARHEAEEQGRKFDAASVKSGVVLYQIQGTSAQILN